MAANDCPDIAPADAVQTLDYFQCPRVFVAPDDDRVKSNPAMYMPGDDTIKDFCSEEGACAALIHILLESYGARVRTAQMDTMRAEFTNGADDREKFYDLFERGSEADTVPVNHVSAAVKAAGLAVTSRRYNRWLKADGCDVSARITDASGKRVRVVRGLKRKFSMN